MVCSNGCIKSPKGSFCSCPNDMELAEDGRTCLMPPPPCSRNHGLCDHFCENTEHSFVCKCYEGYVLRYMFYFSLCEIVLKVFNLYFSF